MTKFVVTIVGSNLEFASDHFIHELCTLGNVSIILYDVKLSSELGKTGQNLVLQARELHPDKEITHTSDIAVALQGSIIVFWGLYLPKHKTFNTAYQEFFTGKFKTEIDGRFREIEPYNPTFLFLNNNGSGLIAANIMGKEVPQVKPYTWVLAPVNDALQTKIYFRVDSAPVKLDDIPIASQEKVEKLLEINGGMLDVDGIITCIKGLFDSRSPRETFLMVGMFPPKNEQDKWKIDGSCCLFMPKTEDFDPTNDMQKIIQNENTAVKKFIA